LRTNAETSNTGAVLDGEIDLFINAYLKWSNVNRDRSVE
jgi:peptide chain release factor 2